MRETEEQEQKKATAGDLTYAASSRCPCGAGLAYASGMDYWECSAILTGEAIPSGQPGSVQHTDRLPFAFWKVKSEQQPSAHGMTTRPESPATALTGKAAVVADDSGEASVHAEKTAARWRCNRCGASAIVTVLGRPTLDEFADLMRESHDAHAPASCVFDWWHIRVDDTPLPVEGERDA